MATPETNSRRWLALAILLGSTVQPALAQVPEPETVFFGRIVNRTGAQEFLVTRGTLQVTIATEGAQPMELSTDIKPYAGGKYSYVLRVPHQAKSLDLEVDSAALPLRISDSGFENSRMLVDGQPARPFGSGAAEFIASQPRRGGVHRLDLEVFNDLEDSDGDGIPDWWEDLYDLDKQDESDAMLRWGGNHYTYLEAFQRGLNPQADDSVPELLTTELVVMKNGATGLLPRTVASVGTPSQINYRLTSLPAGGVLVLRNARPDPRLPDRELKLDDSFSQADVNAGRLEFVHQNPGMQSAKLGVAITNNNPSIEPVEREIALRVFFPEATEGRAGTAWLRDETTTAATAPSASRSAPSASRSAADIWRHRASEAFSKDWTGGARQQDWIGAFLLALWQDYTIWDGSLELPVKDLKVPSAGMKSAEYVRHYGSARNHVLFAGHGVSKIEGGLNDDVLVAGRGQTTLRGNGGADFFVASEGVAIIDDFKPGEGDCLDLSPLLLGWPGPLEEKVQVSYNAGNTRLSIALGEGGAAEVVLRSLNLTLAQLENLRRKNRVFTGDLSPPGGGTNRAPVAAADEGYANGMEDISIPVLANDRDPDGDALHVSSVTQGEFGSVILAGNVVLYLPGLSFAGFDSFTYTVSDGRGGFSEGKVSISYPFPAAAGRYLPLVLDENGKPVGQIQLTLLRSGAFSVTLKLRGVAYSGKGVFAADGSAQVVLKKGNRLVALSLSFDFTDPSYPLTGTLSSESVEGELALSVAAANHKLVPDKARRYTLSLESPVGVEHLTGHGFATIQVTKKYVVRIAGRLADGSAYTSSTVQDSAGSVFWSRDMYRGQGWMLGQMSLASTGGKSLSGSVRWSKPEPDQPALLADLTATLSAYSAPSKAGVSVLDFANLDDRRADFVLTSGGLAQLQASELSFLMRDVIRASDSRLKLRLNRGTGVLSGSLKVEGVTRRIHGVVLQNENSGHGFFLNGDTAGAVSLIPKS